MKGKTEEMCLDTANIGTGQSELRITGGSLKGAEGGIHKVVYEEQQKCKHIFDRGTDT